ncbi:MAG: type 4a pilus biogenesis protein PilO [Candidatus Omnitrophica bacterium]|nr:type 4a pilus biogenesis protein PilO [Candidatus Omnitrophota bacterium]
MKLPSLPNFATMSRRERMLAAGSVLVLSSVLLDRGVLSPWLGHMAKVRREIQQLETDLRNYDALLARKSQIQAEAEAYREYLSPPSRETDMAALLREVEALGKESGVTLGEMKPTEGASSELYQEYTIDVQYQGSLEQWVRFVYLLQTSTALFTIERGAVARTTDEGSGTLQGSLRLSGRVIRRSQQPGASQHAADRHRRGERA